MFRTYKRCRRFTFITMDKKGSQQQETKAGRQKKRKFRGNQHTYKEDRSFASTSAAKLQNTGGNEYEPETDNNAGYVILSFCTVFSALSDLVICKECKKTVQFSDKSYKGLAFKVEVKCECGCKYVYSSPFIKQNTYEINRRFVFCMRLLGVGKQGINTFCAFMDIVPGMSSTLYYSCLDNIYTAASSIYNIITKSAVKLEKELNAKKEMPNLQLSVSGDGTWKKRGFQSLFGVTSLIGKYSGKVIDTVVKSCFCQSCILWKNKSDTEAYKVWYENHMDTCTINHVGSSGKMEVDAVIEMFSRSEEKYGVRYTTYIGDGDSKTFKSLLDANPYGDISVSKKECVGHVQKRMGTRLRNAKKNNKNIGGKGVGKLTDKTINDLTKYYGLAIRRHPNSVEDMRNEIWATYFHKSSSDTKPQHMQCPPGASSWCAWRRAETQRTLGDFKHDYQPLNEKVLEVIKPIYEDLSRDDLLTRCLGGNTQNNNESLNAMIWRFVPKHLHAGFKTIQLATFLAVAIFNEGYAPILQILSVMGVKIGRRAEMFALQQDHERIDRAERRLSNEARRARSESCEKQVAPGALFEEDEESFYAPGMAD